ncbi:MAG: hypothetical protein AMXMBFR33_55560 [Candidatus Xenobia bacterium]
MSGRIRGIPHELIVDRQAKTFTLVSLRGPQAPLPLTDLEQVSIRCERRRAGENSSKTVYPVRLKMKANEIELDDPRSYLSARLTAERLARALEVDLRDEGMGQKVTRSYRELDTPWATMAPAPERALGPAPGRLAMRSGLPRMEIVLPREGLGRPLVTVFAFGVALVVVTGALAFFIPPLREPVKLGTMEPPVVLVAAAMMTLFALPTVLAMLGRELLAALGKVVEASREGLCVRTHLLGLSWRKRFDLGKVEEVRIDANGMTVLDDRSVQKVYFPATEEEAAWLQGALELAVRQP